MMHLKYTTPFKAAAQEFDIAASIYGALWFRRGEVQALPLAYPLVILTVNLPKQAHGSNA